MLYAGFIDQGGGDAAAVLGEVLQLQASQAAQVCIVPGLPAHRLFEIRLIEGHQFVVAIDAATGVGLTELADDGAVHLHLGDDHGFERVFLQTGELEDAQRFIVQGNGARHGQDVVGLVDHQGVHAIASQQGSQRRADRAIADHQDIDRFGEELIVVMHGGDPQPESGPGCC